MTVLLAGAFFAAAFLVEAFFAAAFFFDAAFFAAAFFFAAGSAGIGIVMPGMCWCCAATGAANWASASALAAMSKFDFTMISPVKEATR